MRGIRKLGVAAVALAVGVLGAGKSHAFLNDDFYTSYTQPANALVMPFDQTDNHQTFFMVSNISGLSPVGDGFLAGVTTHWSYWSDSCSHLADVYVCLTLNDTVVVDPSNVSAIDAGNNPVGPKIDLSGNRGFVVVTAYATDEICSDSSVRGDILIDNAIVGSYTFADKTVGSAFGNDAIGLGTAFGDFSAGNYTELPADAYDKFTIQTFNPEDLDNSTVVLLALQEKAGSGSTAPKEVGPYAPPAGGIKADLVFYDNTETPTSLPATTIRCAKFTSLIPGAGECKDSGDACTSNADCGGTDTCESNSLIPNTISLLSPGILRLDNFTPEIGRSSTTGLATGRFVFGLHGQAVGQFGGSSNMKYKVTDLF